MMGKIYGAFKIALKIGICLLFLLAIFLNFYSYSMLTRIVYSFDWLLAKTPLMSYRTGEVYIPPTLSKIFHWLHAFKIFILVLGSLIYNDGYPYFDGKYHWTRKELELCKVREDTLFNGQFAKDPRLQCHIYAIIPLLFVKVELFSAEPPILKFHQFLPPKRIWGILKEVEKRRLFTSQILVRDGLGQNIWQDSIVANNTFIHPFSSRKLLSTFIFIQQRINAFNFGRSEQFNVKKYEIGGHYAPHLDFLVANPEPWLGNRIATFMLILQPADQGGGTVFPDVGFTFMPKAGDALLWLNMMPDYSVAYRSFHGACPIMGGTKIGVTMWIRSVTQELRLPSPLEFGRHFDYKMLIRPKTHRVHSKLWE